MTPLNKIQLGKLRFFLFIFVSIAIAVVALLIKWEFVDNEKYIAIANERYVQTKIPSIRGSILAYDGTTLAYSEPRFDAYVWMPELKSYEDKRLQTREEFIEKVQPIISQTDNVNLENALNSGALWIKIGNKLTQDQKYAIQSLDTNKGTALRGVQFQYTNKRIYPENKLASQILGYVMPNDSQDGYKGVWGLEQNWDGILKPQEGYSSTESDSFGNYIAIGQDETVDAKPGANIYTTINKEIQASLEKNLKAGYEKYQPKSATGIVINPKTGEILAMANYPDFDPNAYYETNDISAFGNKAISTPYEIGSVGKIFTTAAAIDLGRLTPDSVLLPNGHLGCEVISPDPVDNAVCKNPRLNTTGKEVTCICTWDRRAKNYSLNVFGAFVSSDNIGLRHVAMTMSYREFYDYLIKFGVTQSTKVDLSGESVGVMTVPDKWNFADQAVYSYGHGYSITPLEAIMGVSSLANGGIRMQPLIVSKIVYPDNQVTVFKPKQEVQTVSPETCDKMVPMMNGVYLSELMEAKYKPLSKYYVALKTGTALVPYKDRPGYSNNINATFAGFDASPDHKFAMLIKLEEPKVGSLSWQNVRTVWLDTMMDVVDILKVQPYTPSKIQTGGEIVD